MIMSLRRYSAHLLRTGALVLALGGALAFGSCARHSSTDAGPGTAPTTSAPSGSTTTSAGNTSTSAISGDPAQQLQSVQSNLNGALHQMDQDATNANQTYSEGGQP